MPKSIKNHGKSTKMVTRNAPKAILEASRFQERSQGSPASIFLSIIGATWAISASKLPAANSRSGSMKKGIAIGEFEKIVEKTMIFHEILLKIHEIDPK